MNNAKPPKFPKIEEDDGQCVTSCLVPAFRGFQLRNGRIGGALISGESDGIIYFYSDKEVDREIFKHNILWIVDNGHEIREVALKSMVNQYWEDRDTVIDCLIDQDPDDIVPDISSHEDLINLCGVEMIHIAVESTKAKPKFGIEFACNWDPEHGAGVRFTGLKLESSGNASESFMFNR